MADPTIFDPAIVMTNQMEEMTGLAETAKMTRIRRRERRPPATLRTKTGCHNCRTRRRKCDEQHPTCLACAKRHLSCVYPQGAPGTHNAANNTGNNATLRRPASVYLPPSPRPSPRPALVPIRPRREHTPPLLPAHLPIDIDQGLIHYYTSRLCSLLLSRHAHPDYERLFLQSSILPKLQLMVEPLLACASLDLSRQFPAYRPLALAYYAQAVTRTRNTIARKRVQGTEDWLLFNVLHLNLFETWNSDATRDTTPVLLHIQGAAQILKLKLQGHGAHGTSQSTTSDMVVARIAAEAFVYHTVNWSMFHGNPIPITTMPATKLWDSLQPYLELRPFPDASDAENSPVLGVPWQLYRFLSDLALLSHRGLNDSDNDASSVWSLRDALEDWEVQQEQAQQAQQAQQARQAQQAQNTSTLSPYRQRTRLFVLALKLHILKLLHPTIATTDTRVQCLVGEAMGLILPKEDTNEHANEAVLERTDFWPLLVVGSAVVDRAQVAVVRATLQTMAQTMHSVAFAKTKRALETIWAAMAAKEDNECDGLTMLLGGSGVRGLIQGDAR